MTYEPDRLTAGYAFESVLARTRHAVVFRAHRRVSGEPVVLKLAADSRGAESLRNEVHVLRLLRHPSIIGFVDGADGAEPWLALEPAATSLESMVAAGHRLTDDHAAAILAALAGALIALRGEAVVHGDIKPANILLDPAGRPRLADFGSARRGEGGDDAIALLRSMRRAVTPSSALARRLDALLAGPIDAAAVHAAFARTGEAHALGDLPAVVTGPPTLEYSPRPPLAAAAPPPARTRLPALVAAAATWLVLVAAFAVLR